ncbi:uncharacterized protein LOC126672270 [Mercurialis annua]|uniref:uncharacterized protein LOC126672270 n=1 Tax=Mercurialis annua TaxID=3986 RepID=UPI00215E7D03|nr:uncharacterized protein LOC126672270 [Mercurialis annua]
MKKYLKLKIWYFLTKRLDLFEFQFVIHIVLGTCCMSDDFEDDKSLSMEFQHYFMEFHWNSCIISWNSIGIPVAMESVIYIATQLEPGIGQETVGVEASPSPIPVVDDTPADPTVAGQTAHVEANSKKKEYVQRSVVWDHFESIKDGKGVIMQGKCKYCARIYNCNAKKNGTSTLRTHMMKCTKHPHSMETRQALLSFQPVSNVGLAGGSEMFSLTAWKFD